MAISKRHHYIPQFYLRGFTNNAGSYYIFDKEKEEIRKSKPIKSFFEKYRNTSTINGEKSVLLEDMYSHFDGLAAVQLAKIRNSTLKNFSLEPEILHPMKMFISLMYWRIPINDEKIEQVINDITFKEAGFDFKNQKTGKSIATKEFQNKMKNIDLFRKMYRVILPLISSQEKYRSKDYQNWRVYFRGNKLQLTSDNPLIIQEYVDFRSLNRELIFPLSEDKILIHTKQAKPKNLPSRFILELDMLILQQAKRFVCCSNKEYLEYLVKNLYSFSKHHNFKDKMKERLFQHFK